MPINIAALTPRTMSAEDQQQAEQRQQRVGIAQVAQGHGGRRAGLDDTGVAEADQRDEKADADGDGRYSSCGIAETINWRTPTAVSSRKSDAGEEDRAQRHRPGDAHPLTTV